MKTTKGSWSRVKDAKTFNQELDRIFGHKEKFVTTNINGNLKTKAKNGKERTK
jgi:hypothetical protein